VAPSVQRRKGWLTPTTRVPCSTAAKTRNPLKFAGCPKLAKRSQPLVGRSSPYYGNMWRRYWYLISFFPIVDTCLSCEDIARQICGMVPRWQLFMVTLWNRADHYILWSPYVIGQWQTIIFSSCRLFFFFLSFFFFSSPNLSRRRVDVCHTCTHNVALVRI